MVVNSFKVNIIAVVIPLLIVGAFLPQMKRASQDIAAKITAGGSEEVLLSYEYRKDVQEQFNAYRNVAVFEIDTAPYEQNDDYGSIAFGNVSEENLRFY